MGHGHDEQWWQQFVKGLQAVGYDDVLSIEHGDRLVDGMEGVPHTVKLLQQALL